MGVTVKLVEKRTRVYELDDATVEVIKEDSGWGEEDENTDDFEGFLEYLIEFCSPDYILDYYDYSKDNKWISDEYKVKGKVKKTENRG